MDRLVKFGNVLFLSSLVTFDQARQLEPNLKYIDFVARKEGKIVTPENQIVIPIVVINKKKEVAAEPIVTQVIKKKKRAK